MEDVKMLKDGELLTKSFPNLHNNYECFTSLQRLNYSFFLVIVFEQLPLWSLSKGPSDVDSKVSAVKNRQGFQLLPTSTN